MPLAGNEAQAELPSAQRHLLTSSFAASAFTSTGFLLQCTLLKGRVRPSPHNKFSWHLSLLGYMLQIGCAPHEVEPVHGTCTRAGRPLFSQSLTAVGDILYTCH